MDDNGSKEAVALEKAGLIDLSNPKEKGELGDRIETTQKLLVYMMIKLKVKAKVKMLVVLFLIWLKTLMM